MIKCPICSNEINEKENSKCQECGYDTTTNFVHYRTVCEVRSESKNIEKVSEKRGKEKILSEVRIVKINCYLGVLSWILCIMLLFQFRMWSFVGDVSVFLFEESQASFETIVLIAVIQIIVSLAVTIILKNQIHKAKEIRGLGRILQGIAIILAINLLYERMVYRYNMMVGTWEVFSDYLFLLVIPYLFYVAIMIQREVYGKSNT